MILNNIATHQDHAPRYDLQSLLYYQKYSVYNVAELRCTSQRFFLTLNNEEIALTYSKWEELGRMQEARRIT